MGKIFKRLLATIMVVLIVLTSVPLSGFVGMEWSWLDFSVKASAATEGYYTYEVKDGKATITDVDGFSIRGDVTIPSTLGGYNVTTIGNYAFRYCDDITSVIIPDSVTTIGVDAFSLCYGLTRVTIGNSVTTIGADAFCQCYELTSVTIPDSVTTIGTCAFVYCNSLTSVTIPDSVTTIGVGAFSSCDSLTSVTIPDSVTTIGVDAFGSCDSLTSLTVATGNKYYCSVDGVLFDKNKKTLIQYPSGNSRTSYSVPDSVTAIGESAFYSCDRLTSVTIPDSVTTIGVTAFCNSDRLTSVTIGKGVTEIRSTAFLYCHSLTDVYYSGTQDSWNNISMGGGNEDLLNSTIHYSSGNDDSDSEEDNDDLGYKLRLRSDGAYSDSIAVGKEITFWTFLYNNGERENCNRAYAISFDTPGIFEVVKTKKTSSSFDVTLKACKAGTTNMTVSDSQTGAYVTIRLKANNPVDVITMDEVQGFAKEYQKGKLTHFYDCNGLYVDSYSYSKIKDGSYNVSMNVYNEKAHHGAVVSYDKNGKIADYELINPHNKLPTSLWDGLFDSFDLLNDHIAKFKDKYLYDEESFTTRTRIDKLNVPDGGYFVITNNYLENEYVFFANSINLAIDLICAYSKVNKVDVPDELPEKATEKVLEEIVKGLGPDQFKTVFEKLVKNFAKDLTISNVDVFMSGMVSTFKEFEINIEEIIKDTLEDLMTDTESHLDFAEGMVLTLFGADAIKTALSSLGYINTAIKLIDVFSSSLAPEIAVYTPPENPTIRVSNGVSVTSEKPLASDCVLHSYVINDTSDVMTEAKPTLDALKSNYQICDITLYKSSQAVQPDAKITVMIPIPDGYNKNNIQVFWYKDDGTLQSMNAVVKGDYAVFETDHLSYYVLVENHKCYYKTSVTAATCTKAGTKTFTCICGDTYTETIAKLGHSYSKSYTVDKKATCTSEGSKSKHCTRNGCTAKTSVTAIAKLAHKGGNATCKAKAKCTVCGKSYGSLNASNHKKIVTLKAKSATYKSTGLTEGKKCSDCGKITVAQKKVARKKLKKVSGLKKKAVKLASGSKSTLTLTWSKVKGAEKYEVYQKSGKKWKKVGTTSKTTLTVKKLKANKSYKFRIRAVAGSNKGSYSSIYTAKMVPLKPTLSKLTAGSKQLTANWKTVAAVTGYEVQASTSSKFTSKTTKKVTLKSAKTKKTTIKKLKKDKKYYVKVRAYKTVSGKKIYGTWSSVKSVKVK